MKFLPLLILILFLSACAAQPTSIEVKRTAPDGSFVEVFVKADPKVWENLKMDYNGTWHIFSLSAGNVGPAPNPWAQTVEHALDYAVPAAMCQISPLMCPPKPVNPE